jgi:leucyl aminopeptidase
MELTERERLAGEPQELGLAESRGRCADERAHAWPGRIGPQVRALDGESTNGHKGIFAKLSLSCHPSEQHAVRTPSAWSTRAPSVLASSAPIDACRTDLIVLPTFARGPLPDVTAGAAARLGFDALRIAQRSGISGTGDSCCVALSHRLEGPDILLVCVGGKDGATTVGELRGTAQQVGRTLSRKRVACALVEVALADGDAGSTVAESLLLGAYAYDAYITSAPSPPLVEEIVLTGISEKAVALGRTLAETTNYARDLVNAPPSEMTPSALAECCIEEARRYGLESRVLSKTDLIEGGFGGLVAVGAASTNDPVLAVVELARGDGPVTALIGKGITFDSGGIQAKSSALMRATRFDMAGAASALATVKALCELEVGANVRIYLACAENAIGCSAYRPGDIVRHRSGRTTEVVSTDAEGRLVLADAISYAAERKPDEVITVCTLTGGTGLGRDLWGVLGTDGKLVSSLLDAGREAGDPGWMLPLWDGYAADLHSDIADAVNYDFGWFERSVAGGPAAMLGALFLRPFAGDIRWAHIDMAATCWRMQADETWAAGATGSPTRALVRHLLARAELACP